MVVRQGQRKHIFMKGASDFLVNCLSNCLPFHEVSAYLLLSLPESINQCLIGDKRDLCFCSNCMEML